MVSLQMTHLGKFNPLVTDHKKALFDLFTLNWTILLRLTNFVVQCLILKLNKWTSKNVSLVYLSLVLISQSLVINCH